MVENIGTWGAIANANFECICACNDNDVEPTPTPTPTPSPTPGPGIIFIDCNDVEYGYIFEECGSNDLD